MAKLSRALASQTHGQGHIVCLIDEAGLGKNRLLEKARAEWEKHYQPDD